MLEPLTGLLQQPRAGPKQTSQACFEAGGAQQPHQQHQSTCANPTAAAAALRWTARRHPSRRAARVLPTTMRANHAACLALALLCLAGLPASARQLREESGAAAGAAAPAPAPASLELAPAAAPDAFADVAIDGGAALRTQPAGSSSASNQS